MGQVIVAAELTQHTSDPQQLRPLLAATTATLQAAGLPSDPGPCWPTVAPGRSPT
jgi:hypothetical protein